MNAKNNFINEALTYEVLGCAYEAFKIVGIGFDEIRYHKVFHQQLLKKGLDAKYKVPVHLNYVGERIADFEIDEIVEDKLIVELKCIQTNFLPENYAQILTYLKMTRLNLGLLINFGLQKAHTKRIIFDERRRQNIECWDEGYFKDSFKRKVIDTVITAINNIDKSLGVAYHSKIYQAALGVELKRNQVNYDNRVSIELKFDEIQFSPFEIDYWLVEKSLLLGILAGKDKPRSYDLLRMRSYLKKLNLQHGLIAYWSTKNLQLYGIYQP